MRGVFLVVTCSLPSAVSAAALDQLHLFLETTRTARAAFSQKVVNKSGKASQMASGTMVFSRPGKFRWEYQRPYSQLIVGDGSKLWTYDKELNQVVVKPMGAALGSTPAALLAGANDMEKNFSMAEGGAEDGMEWLNAEPKSKEAGFERMRIAFKAGVPQVMEVRDNFGQTTLLQFSGFERNPSLAADSFRFTPPKGADVVGE